MNDFGLIIFDCDGVLVNSDIIAAQVESTLLNEVQPIEGVEFTVKRLTGLKRRIRSSTSTQRLDTMLGKVGLKSLFTTNVFSPKDLSVDGGLNNDRIDLNKPHATPRVLRGQRHNLYTESRCGSGTASASLALGLLAIPLVGERPLQALSTAAAASSLHCEMAHIWS